MAPLNRARRTAEETSIVAFSLHAVMGKGRREQVLPLWRETTAVVKAWLAIRPHGLDTVLFLNGAGRAMTRSGF